MRQPQGRSVGSLRPRLPAPRGPCTWCSRAFPAPALRGDRPGVPDGLLQRGGGAAALPPKPVASCFAAHKALKAGRSWDIKGPGKLIVLN